jgi:nucleotidyltransferase/DNA polymerase involved in DNA repair
MAAGQRGVVAAASYEARKFGVRSAMPSVTAGRLCPQGVFVRPRMDRYKEESGLIRQLMAETGEGIEPMSIDEAYLDLSAQCQAEDADASLRACKSGRSRNRCCNASASGRWAISETTAAICGRWWARLDRS